MKSVRAVAVLLRSIARDDDRIRTLPRFIPKTSLWCAFVAILLLALAANAQQAGMGTGPADSIRGQVVQPVSSPMPELHAAPQNPEFVNYLERLRSGNAPSLRTSGGHSLGFIPTPLTLPHLKDQPSELAVGAAFPASYDLRTTNRVSPVKDQGACGSCWAFGTYGSAESILKPGESRDYSENNLKNLHRYDNTPCQGGNYQMSSGYLARWSGPVNETDDPYKPTDTNTSPTNAPVQKHEQQIIFIPGRTSATDNNQIKTALMTRGAVAVSMYMDESSSYLNTTTWSYYFNDASVTTTNHAVTVIGWNDSYPKTNFTQTPAGNGAFLVKNSWGTAWGQSGYFWVSYYDLNFATGETISASFGGEKPVSTYTQRYEYDPLGWTSSVGWTENPETFYYANIFTATQAGYLDAASTYVASNNSTYSLKIYKGVIVGNPVSGTLAFSDTGKVPFAGYQTFTVNPVHLVNGDKFSVVMMLTTPGNHFPAPFQTAIDGYSSKATAATGRGYYSADGVNWGDIVTFDSTASFNLKAFASADSAPPTATPTFTPAAGTYTTAQNVTIVAPAGSTIYYTIDGSTPSIFSSVYSAPISIYTNTIVRAIATSASHSTSAIATAKYTINLPAAASPTIKPAGGVYGMAKLVVLAPVTTGTSVYYTLDGTVPTRSSTKYTTPIAVKASTTIKAMAASTSYGPSPVVSAVYTLVASSATFSGLATSITATTATLNATVNDFSGAGQYWFMWGTTTSLGNTTAKITLPASASVQNITAALTTLTSKTVYFFRPVISTPGGVSYGAIQSFTTN